jgi:peptide/nickel transport system substrate-binding protein
MAAKSRITRRSFLRFSSLSIAGIAGTSLLAACGQAATPAPAKPTAAAGTATSAPAPAAATTAPAAAAKPTGAAGKTEEQKIGRNLIGKLEGPEVITDTSKYPKQFKEAPALAELVKAGKLPPIEQRLPTEPLVIKPVHGIGKYGGMWRRGFTGPADKWNGYRAAGSDGLLFWDYTGQKVVPNIARDWKVSDDGKTTTIFLRKGMKWSDGSPFTADDFLFWYEDIYLNKDLTPSPFPHFAINFKQGKVEKVDDLTVKYVFPDPYPMFPDVLAGSRQLGGPTLTGMEGTGGYFPKKYLKDFHPKYVPQAELDQKVKDGKMDNWVRLFKFKSDWALNPECPALTAWRTVTPANTPNWTMERNPYSIWVDTEGNQLPYIDKIVFTLAENLEVLNLRAVAGELDCQERHIDMQKIPVFLENQQKGAYKLYLDPSESGTDAGLQFNQNFNADPEIAKWYRNRDFRRALSLGVNREQLNETFWLGTGTPSSVAPDDTNVFSPGPEYRTKWSTYDPKQANEMLDKLGLTKKDSEGFRQRLDGKGRLRLELMTYGGQFLQNTQIGEMIKEQWKAIGIHLEVGEVERSLGMKRTSANDVQMFMWSNDGTEDMFTTKAPIPDGLTSAMGPLWGDWFATGGQKGVKPDDPEMLRAMDLFMKAYGMNAEDRVKAGKEIWRICCEEVWFLGTVGLSGASVGTRIAKTALGNIPARQANKLSGRTPALSRPMTFYWKT